MEFLKTSIIAFALLMTTSLFAQDFTALQIAFNKSIDLESKQDYKGAIDAIKPLNTSTNYETNLRLGWCHYLAGNYNESLTYYQKSIALMPAATEPLWGIAYPQGELKKWTDLYNTYLKIIKLDPKNTTANYRLGLSAYYSKDYITAKKYFDIVLGLYPTDYNTLLMSAWTNYFLGKKTEAKILFNKTLLISPNDESALEGIALIK